MIGIFYTIITVLNLFMMYGENEEHKKRTYCYAFSICVAATIALEIIKTFA